MDKQTRSEWDKPRKKEQRQVTRPPILRGPPALPRGPKLYRTPKDLGYKGPVGEPPPGFVRGTTSATEWMVYFGMAKVTGFPENYREPPFMGAPGVWTYQKNWDAQSGRMGSSVIDFMLFAGAWTDMDTAIRVQTEAFHLYTGMDQQTHDALQFARLSEYMRVIDIYDYDFVWDQTGQAIVLLLKDSLAGNVTPNPINGGTTMRGTRVRPISV